MNAATQSPTPQPPSTPGSLGIGSARALMRVDLDQQPFVVAWEITRACLPPAGIAGPKPSPAAIPTSSPTSKAKPSSIRSPTWAPRSSSSPDTVSWNLRPS